MYQVNVEEKKKKEDLNPTSGVSVVVVRMLPICKSQTCIFRKKPLHKLPCENSCIWKVIALILQSAISYTKVICIPGNFKESMMYILRNTSTRVKYEIYVLSGVFEHANNFILIK